MSNPLLVCENLQVRFTTHSGEVTAVNGVDFEVHRGDCIGIVGESGSGKTQTAMALMGLLADNADRKRQRQVFRRGDPQCARRTAQPDSRPFDFDDLPGPDDVADAVHAHRRATVRSPRAAFRNEPRGSPGAGDRGARNRADSRARAPVRHVSSPVVRGAAAKGHDRPGAVVRAGPPDRRRADHGAWTSRSRRRSWNS